MLLLLFLFCSTLVDSSPLDQNGLVHKRETNIDRCNTKDCNAIAEQILKSINISVDPCDSFYDYACGSWPENNPIPAEEVSWSKLDNIRRMRSEQFRAVLEEAEKEDDVLPVKMAKKLYRSCMDEDGREERGISTLINIVNKLNGWPIAMPTWRSKDVTWQDIHKSYFSIFHQYILFDVSIMPDSTNSSQLILSIGHEVLHLFEREVDDDSREIDSDVTLVYWTTLVKAALYMAEYNNYTLDNYTVTVDAIQIVNLVVAFEKITNEAKGNNKYNKNSTRMTVGELQKWYDSASGLNEQGRIDWLEVIRLVFNDTDGKRISETEPVLVSNKQSLHQLASLLSNTSTRELVNYMHWMFISECMEYTNKYMRDLKFEISFKIYDAKQVAPRWLTCVDQFPMKGALSYMYVKRFFSDETLPEVFDMVDRIQSELKDRINHTSWLSNVAKQYMRRKVNKIVKHIAYPDSYKDDTVVYTLYDPSLKIGSDYLKNVLNYNRIEREIPFESFKLPLDREQWENYPLMVNAYYYLNWNSILIPAAEISAPYFTPSMPSAVNYGSIGFVVGHEMGHSIDNDAIEFDQDGNILPSNVSKELLTAYKDKAKCFVKQFSKYMLGLDENGNTVMLDGQLTQSENMADTLGIQLAFSAFRKKMEERGTSFFQIPRQLNNLTELNDDQLFFLSFATSWCSAERPKFEKSHYNTFQHSPLKFRINGALSNMDSFASVFHCPLNSPMNPSRKCNLWT